MLSTPVAIFTCRLLPQSETFIRAQGEAMRKYTPYYVGCRHVAGLELPGERTMVVNSGGRAGHLAEAAFKYFGRNPTLERRLAALRPRLIHAHFGPCAALALPLARRLGLPLVVTYHGTDATTSDDVWRRGTHTHRIYLRRRPDLFRDARLFIAVSNHVRSKLIAQGAAEDNVAVHYIGIDTQYFAPPPPTSEQRRTQTVLFVGRLTQLKGCDYLIRAMTAVQAKHPGATLKIIGDGPARVALERLALERLRRCEFLGAQPHDVVRREMGAARLFCVPSVSTSQGSGEGFGLVFAEAQAMGTPVVSTTCGGIPEAVAHGRTGLLVGERDVEGLARAILCLFDDQDLWRRFTADARAFVCERFDLAKQTRMLEKLYDAHALAPAGLTTHDERPRRAARVPYATN
jgi:glycosyltransferase involved in cell wall biosynthesis